MEVIHPFYHPDSKYNLYRLAHRIIRKESVALNPAIHQYYDAMPYIYIEKADEILKEKSPAITDYPAPGSSGTIHDYFSNGSYWWPNPDTNNHLPYIRRDGMLNPENFTKHKDLLLKLSLDISVLYRAFHMTGERKYIAKMEENLYSFFIDSSTNMNPSLMFAQAIPGICSGRSIGIIDTLQLIDIPVITLEAERNGYFSSDTILGLKTWFSKYASWLIESPFGKKESEEKNNHSVTYYAQLSSFSLLSEESGMIKKQIRDAFKSQLLGQMGEDGLFPEELKRTRPYGYSIFILDNLSTIALLASTENDLWHYNGLLRKAIDAFFPYIENKNLWPYGKDIEMWDTMPSKSAFLYFASYAYDNPRFRNAWNKIKEPDLSRASEARHIAIKTPEAYLPFLGL